jgi:YidC/Oxa1 family membrane protein insertase
MLNTIAKPFGLLMLWFYNITGNYGLAIIFFALVVNLILLPFMMKSKRGMMRQMRLQPKIAELQKRHEGNQQKLNEEMSRLYREEKVNPMSGCIWSLIPFPILIALYQAIRYPITTMMGVPSDLLAEGGSIYQKLIDLGYSLSNYTTSTRSAYEQIYQSKFITEHFADFSALSDKLQPISYKFLGLDLSVTPNYKIWEFDFSSTAVWVPALCMFLIPFTAAFVSWLAMKVSMKMNPQSSGAAAQQQQSVNKSMELMMPLMSVWFAFIMPAALGIYWIINSVIGAVRDAVLTKVYTKKMDQEDAVRMAARSVRDAEIERKREETERLRAANATEQNRNTSKKKMQAVQKQKDDERRAAVDKAERAERRVRLGISEPEKPASQVGGRRYARGRAYVEDRYENPEGAEEATLAAAAESEFGEAIDENVEETGVGAAAEAEASFDALTEEESEAEFPEDEQFDDGADDATDDEQEKQEI